MKLDELTKDLGLAVTHGDAAVEVTDLADDSRRVTPGCAFVARRGAAGDGAAYIEDAIKRGAIAVIRDQPGEPTDRGVAWVAPVGDGPVATGQALAGRLAERFFGHPSRRLRLIGVTGTNGKTTTSYMIRHLLTSAGVRCGMIGTVVVDHGRADAPPMPAELTTPGAVEFSRHLAAMVEAGCGAAVVEASSHALDQGRCDALSFDVAVFTNLTGDHLDYHPSMDAYAQAKARLFELLGQGEAKNKWAVINGDDPSGQRMADAAGPDAHLVWCRLDGRAAQEEMDADVCHATIIELAADSTLARYDGPWGSPEVRLPFVGRHNVINILEAIAASNAVASLGKNLRQLLADCPAVPGRLEPVRPDAVRRDPRLARRLPTVLVDYAHTHDALDNVLGALRPVTTGRLIVVFGCGGDRDRTKRPKMARIAEAGADRVIVTSDNPRTEDAGAIINDILAGFTDAFRGDGERLHVEPDRAAAIARAIAQADRDDVVLLAGKGHEDYQIIGTTKRHFDDREQAAAALMARLERLGAQA